MNRARTLATDHGWEVFDSRTSAMRFSVGEGYDSSPEEWGGTTPQEAGPKTSSTRRDYSVLELVSD